MKDNRKEKNTLSYRCSIDNNGVDFVVSTMQNNKKTNEVNIFLLIISGLFIGFINGFWGGGGGMICVPILVNLLKLPEKKGHATTILIMLPLCISSFIVYLIKGSIDVYLAVNIGIGFVIGGIIGAMLLKNINNVVLKLIFAVIIILGGIKLII
jgi:uncharacterized membrane protein YfcA